jgi:hypothetical protein
MILKSFEPVEVLQLPVSARMRLDMIERHKISASTRPN